MREIKLSFLIIKLTFSFILSVTCLVNAQVPELKKNINKKSDWDFSITPYGLFAFNSTDVGGTQIRQSFNDLNSITNAGFQLAAHTRFKRFHLFFDGTWANLGDKTSNAGLKIDLEIIQRIFAFNLGYNVYENFHFKENEVLKGWRLIIDFGAKYWKNDLFLNYSLSHNDNILLNGTLNQLTDWWDLMLGAKADLHISNKFSLNVSMDIGGFGIGNSSKFTYDFLYLNMFKVSKLITINAGFRNFNYKRSDVSSSESLDTNVNVFGPLIGASFRP
ncbi:hypothetical protein VOI54_14825 [Tamlana sp. 2201CG12-4]|uniref:hypothetical protein n=1 Tax=Tamlana sp. 2201CG12-4 TaxID=3112582 RepID=UPI002DBB0407|nr:hypothetical protein [Tamlana sp. 2201CG12-4]MEC3908301.1 hypothetical protein [Tamlana sp. 2201CG12-4]